MRHRARRLTALLVGLLYLAQVAFVSRIAEAVDAARDAAIVLTEQPLFESGRRGYKCYRIPALVTTVRETLLAFCEARKNSCSDHGDIDLVIRRSSDGGRTWSDMQVIADDGGYTIGNPCPVVDKISGTIWMPLCRDNKRVLMMKSTDDGRTWSAAKDITKDAMDPAWHWVGTGPGHGVQLKSGRLLIPCWADARERLGEVQLSYMVYSDDHGRSWKRGEALDYDTSDECEVVELADGSLYMTGRSRQRKKQRAYAFSKDEGHRWSAVRNDPRLPELSCQGSIIRLSEAGRFEKNRIVLAAPASTAARDHLTIRLSYDECRSWPVSKVLHHGSSAYSDLAVTADRHILCLYEADSYTKIVLASFNLPWLTDGKDRLQKNER